MRHSARFLRNFFSPFMLAVKALGQLQGSAWIDLQAIGQYGVPTVAYQNLFASGTCSPLGALSFLGGINDNNPLGSWDVTMRTGACFLMPAHHPWMVLIGRITEMARLRSEHLWDSLERVGHGAFWRAFAEPDE